jgi:GxxExxY protein
VDDQERLVYRILEAARSVHSALGPGFVEGIYCRALAAELKAGGFKVDRERAIKIWYGLHLVGKHRLDLVVDSSVIVELKAGRCHYPCASCTDEFVHSCDQLSAWVTSELWDYRIAVGGREIA